MPDDRKPIPLTAQAILIGSPDFVTVQTWPFSDDFVQRLLRDDIPHRVVYGNCRVFLYRDPNGQPVGFGCLDISDDHTSLTGDHVHPHIPLLGVNPTITSLGYGTTIVRHLIAEAAVLAAHGHCADRLFLEVYTTSTKAISLYKKAKFQTIGPEQTDPMENKSYFIMARRVSSSARDSLFP